MFCFLVHYPTCDAIESCQGQSYKHYQAGLQVHCVMQASLSYNYYEVFRWYPLIASYRS